MNARRRRWRSENNWNTKITRFLLQIRSIVRPTKKSEYKNSMSIQFNIAFVRVFLCFRLLFTFWSTIFDFGVFFVFSLSIIIIQKEHNDEQFCVHHMRARWSFDNCCCSSPSLRSSIFNYMIYVNIAFGTRSTSIRCRI